MACARLILISAFTLCLVVACGETKPAHVIIKAPFRKHLGGQEIAIPLRGDLQNAYFQSGPRPLLSFVSAIVCRNRGGGPSAAGCEEFGELPIHANGVTVYLRPRSGSSFQWLRERPAASAPGSKPLIRLPVFIRSLPSAGSGPDEKYQLSRLQSSTVEPSLVTTDQKWPIAACSKDPKTKTAHCNIGFLIGRLNIEAYYSTGSTAEVTQRDIWQVATALDRKLRSFIVS